MKRRNADSGKMRRPVKRTKIVEGMYGNSMVYLKFVMIWATVVMADYMLEFRFEFLWPFWLMLRSVCDSFRYQGVIFSVFFICIALTSDMICFFFIPLQYLIFAASTYVWVQFMWYTFAERGVCVPTAALAVAVLYAEGAVRARAAPELWRPLAAHCLGFPALTLGFGVKAYVGQRLRQRRQRQVRAENEFYFQLLRDALPESALEQKTEDSKGTSNGECTQGTQTHAQAHAHMNGSVRRRCARDHNGVCVADHALHAKLDKLEKQVQRDKSHMPASTSAPANTNTNVPTSTNANTHASTQASSHPHSNGAASGPGAPLDEHEQCKGSKSSKCEKKEVTTVNERKKHKNKDKDNSDSLKNTEITKEVLVKEKDVESTKENVKSNKEVNSHKEKEKDKEREKEKEKEKERKEEKEKELKDKEREQKDKEQRARSLSLELRRVRAELSAARAGEAEARRALAHAQDGSKESRRLERRLSEERRARTAAEHQLLRARHAARTPSGECESEWCRSRRSSSEAEVAALRRELQRAREHAAQLQRDLAGAKEQVRTLEAWEAREAGERSRAEEALAAAAALQERAGHLERALSAETRVKLDLLSALGDAKRHMRIQESLISRQEKEIEELKAQMLAVMPTEFVTPVTSSVSKLRLSDGSPLDPNASVYTPKQLCSDA